MTFQTTNPNYPQPNPFYFEGRIDWNLLKITIPTNAWEFAQRGIYKQDDLEDPAGAIVDYRQSVAMNGLTNGTCQIVTGSIPTSGTLNPPPCMFTVRLRLAGLLRQSSPQEVCHNELPRSHTPLTLFAGGGHAALAMLDTRACLTCHTFQNTCFECHTEGLSPQSVGKAKPSAR